MKLPGGSTIDSALGLTGRALGAGAGSMSSNTSISKSSKSISRVRRDEAVFVFVVGGGCNAAVVDTGFNVCQG